MTATAEKITWSKSQISALNQCQRKVSLSQSEEPHIQFLKNLKNRHLWSGALVHTAIADLLKTVRQESPLPQENDFIEQIRSQMREDFKSSKNIPDKKGRLFEHEYSLPLNPALWQERWKQVETGLHWFFQSKWLERMKALGPESWKVIDEVLLFDVGGIEAYVKIDVALELQDRIILIDWKTGNIGPQDDQALQVAALYAHDVWEAEPEKIDAYIVSLSKGTQRSVSINEETLMETQLKIQEETEKLQMARSQFSDDPMAVSMTTNLSHCMQCNFQRLCHPKGVGV